MQFDYNMLRSLISLSDEKLWQTIHTIAAQNGIRLPEAPPPAAELSRLRQVLGSTENPNLHEAIQIVNQYKKQSGV